jgi:hypothetical protein
MFVSDDRLAEQRTRKGLDSQKRTSGIGMKWSAHAECAKCHFQATFTRLPVPLTTLLALIRQAPDGRTRTGAMFFRSKNMRSPAVNCFKNPSATVPLAEWASVSRTE